MSGDVSLAHVRVIEGDSSVGTCESELHINLVPYFLGTVSYPSLPLLQKQVW